MYIKNRHSQLRFTDFQQPIELKMNSENRWVKKSGSNTMVRNKRMICEIFSENAEREGFEPSVGFPTLVFETNSLSHSDISPYTITII